MERRKADRQIPSPESIRARLAEIADEVRRLKQIIEAFGNGSLVLPAPPRATVKTA